MSTLVSNLHIKITKLIITKHASNESTTILLAEHRGRYHAIMSDSFLASRRTATSRQSRVGLRPTPDSLDPAAGRASHGQRDAVRTASETTLHLS